MIFLSLALLDSCSDNKNCMCPDDENCFSDPTLYLPLAVGNWWKWSFGLDDSRLQVYTDSVVAYQALPFGGYCYQIVRRFFDYDPGTGSVLRDTLDLNFGAYEVRGNCLYYWNWDYGMTLHDTIAYRIIDAPLEKGKEWDSCMPNRYVYVSDPAETLRTRCPGEPVHVRYRAMVNMPVGIFPRVYEIWFSEHGDRRWCAFAPGVGLVSIGNGDLIDYHLEN